MKAVIDKDKLPLAPPQPSTAPQVQPDPSVA